MLNCDTIKLELSAYRDGALPPEERGRVELHLSECSACKAELSAIDRVRESLASLPKLKVPSGLNAKIKAQIKAESTQPKVQPLELSQSAHRSFSWLAMVSGAAATLAIGLLCYVSYFRNVSDTNTSSGLAKKDAVEKGAGELARDAEKKLDDKVPSKSEALNKAAPPAPVLAERALDPMPVAEEEAKKKVADAKPDSPIGAVSRGRPPGTFGGRAGGGGGGGGAGGDPAKANLDSKAGTADGRAEIEKAAAIAPSRPAPNNAVARDRLRIGGNEDKAEKGAATDPSGSPAQPTDRADGKAPIPGPVLEQRKQEADVAAAAPMPTRKIPETAKAPVAPNKIAAEKPAVAASPVPPKTASITTDPKERAEAPTAKKPGEAAPKLDEPAKKVAPGDANAFQFDPKKELTDDAKLALDKGPQRRAIDPKAGAKKADDKDARYGQGLSGGAVPRTVALHTRDLPGLNRKLKALADAQNAVLSSADSAQDKDKPDAKYDRASTTAYSITLDAGQMNAMLVSLAALNESELRLKQDEKKNAAPSEQAAEREASAAAKALPNPSTPAAPPVVRAPAKPLAEDKVTIRIEITVDP